LAAGLSGVTAFTGCLGAAVLATELDLNSRVE
jgi:hypothetical protein